MNLKLSEMLFLGNVVVVVSYLLNAFGVLHRTSSQ